MDRPSDEIHGLDERELAAHANFLRRVARRLVRDEQRADDVAQETWRVTLAKPPAQVRSWRGWLGAAAANVARQFARRTKRREGHEKRAAAREAMPSAADVAARLETERRLIDAVAALDEGDRALVLLRHFDGLAPRAIAKRMKLPVETVKTRLKRALERLRARLVERGGDRERLHSGLLLIANGLVAKVGAAGGVVAGGVVLSLKGKVVAALATAAAIALVVRFGGPMRARRGGADGGAALAAAATARDATTHGGDVDAATAGVTRVAEVTAPVVAPATSGDAEDPTAIFGRFVDTMGRPIEGVEVCSDPSRLDWPPQRTHAETWPATKSDAEGRFFWRRPSARLLPDAAGWWGQSGACSGWADALAVDFVAWRRGFVRRDFQLNGVAHRTLSVGDLVLEREARIAGSIEVPDGVDPASATIEIEDTIHQAPEQKTPTLEPLKECVARTHADAHGRFEVGGLAAGKYRVWASLPESLHTPSDVIELASGQGCEEVSIRVEVPSTKGEILRVDAERPDGSPCAGANVWVEFHEPRRSYFALSFVADATGHVDVPTYGREVRSASAWDPADRLLPARRRIMEVPKSPCVLRLREAFKLSLEVVSADSTPLQGVSIRTRIEGDASEETDSDDRSAGAEPTGTECRVDLWLPDRTIEFTVQSEGFEDATVGPLRVRDAADPVPVVLRPQPALTGRVFAEGRPIAGAVVRVCDASYAAYLVQGAPSRASACGTGRGGLTDAAGRFRVLPCQDGRIYLRGHADGYAPAEVGPFDVKMGEVVDGIDIELTRGGSLVGTIAPGRDGSLARHVVLSNGDGAPLSWPVAPDGTFHVDHLTPGPWNVRVNPRAVSYFEGNMEMVFDATTCELPSNCVIREGETTTLTLTADDTLAAVVHGKVSGIDDPARWCARIAGFRGDIDQTPAPSHDSGWLAQIGEDGSFELRFEIGRRKIVLWPNRDMSAKPSQCAFVWTDDLHEGPQTFEATLALGRIEGDVGSVAADRPLFVEADATTSGGLEFHARMLVDASGHFVFADAPAGEVRLHVPKTEIARTVTVSAGATATIQLR